MKGVLIGFICGPVYLLTLLCGPIQISAVPAVLRHRRQYGAVDAATSTEEPATNDPISFDKLLEDMFKKLGIPMNNTYADTTMKSSVSSPEENMSEVTTSSPNAANQNVTPKSTLSWDTWSIGTTILASVSSLSDTGSIDDNSKIMSPENDTFLLTAMPENLTSLPTPNAASSPTTLVFTSPLTTKVSELTSQTEPECQMTPLLDFCMLPEALTTFFGPTLTLYDILDFVLSLDIVNELVDTCPAGTWCLNSKHSYEHLEEKVGFWTNSSDFLNLCWSSLDACLRTVVGYYVGCENYEMYVLIENMNKLLCEMKEEPRASRECIEQTMKALHVSMADFHRNKQDLEDNEDTDICQRRNAKMASNFLCATDVCGLYGDLLNEFVPWAWFADSLELYEAMCVYDPSKCVTRKEEIADVEEEEKEATEEEKEETQESSEELDSGLSDTDNDNSDSKEHEGYVSVSKEIDFPSTMIIGAISLATIGFVVLLSAIWLLRRRRNKHRTRDGLEYMQILPDLDD